MIFGSFGSGETVLVFKLCELQKLRMPESKIFVAASLDGACDAVIPKITTSELMIIRRRNLKRASKVVAWQKVCKLSNHT